MALILRSVNICSFIDGAREQGKQTDYSKRDGAGPREGFLCAKE